MATSKEVKMPIQMRGILDKKEKYDILDNDILEIKNYILERAT